MEMGANSKRDTPLFELAARYGETEIVVHANELTILLGIRDDTTIDSLKRDASSQPPRPGEPMPVTQAARIAPGTVAFESQ
jgi:hypothetical protein